MAFKTATDPKTVKGVSAPLRAFLRLFKGPIKAAVMFILAKNQEFVLNKILGLLKGVPLSGEELEALVTRLYDAFEVIVGNLIDQI